MFTSCVNKSPFILCLYKGVVNFYQNDEKAWKSVSWIQNSWTHFTSIYVTKVSAILSLKNIFVVITYIRKLFLFTGRSWGLKMPIWVPNKFSQICLHFTCTTVTQVRVFWGNNSSFILFLVKYVVLVTGRIQKSGSGVRKLGFITPFQSAVNNLLTLHPI